MFGIGKYLWATVHGSFVNIGIGICDAESISYSL